ncbi:hypothetical protein F5B22DRAFT_652677 [Xylaria bambusicola]|uniref:uncharacterized protein n=1 Tax=Xylaria bambusicola TaxID=326684 RepID=UPI002008284B|nr:uncharacterized protein F5B22DRAFT_652677 [Xylaria bambusicola]KAI0502831.1 hypothetical protein F5B22DRAFT_652677 [Xylaria bambusicola]
MDGEEDDLGPFWAEAKRAYEQECEHPLDFDVDDTREPYTVGHLLELIESRGSQFGAFREKHSRLWNKLERFCEPVVALGGVTGEVFNALDGIGGPIGAVLKGITHLVSAAEHVTSAYDWVETVFSELQNFSDRLRSHTRTTITSAMRRIIIAILAFILRIIGRSELLIKRGRVREYLRVAFIGKDQKTKELLDELNKVIANEGRLTLALTHEKTEQARDLAAQSVEIGQQASEKIDDVHNDVKALEGLTRELKVQQIDQHLLENMHHVLKTTAVTQTDDWYSLFKRNLLEGSGAWLQKEELFDVWMQHQAPILWVFGGPGAGKTMLSTWLITMLNKQFEAKSEMSLATHVGYFFIKENVDNLRNPNILFKTMAWQIQQTDPLFRRHAATVCGFNRKTAGAEDTWENLFLDFYQGFQGQDRRAVLIIDGLDEAELHTQRRILRLMKDYVSSIRAGQPARVQFAIFGRLTLRPELERIQLDREEKIIEVSSVKNHEDMENYITNRVKNLTIVRLMRSKKPDGKEAKRFARGVRQKVLEGAAGVFLWAQLLLDQMEGKDDRQINQVLANPPENLYDMIYSVFKRISQDEEVDKPTVNRLLAWVAFAKRPLSFGELDVILRTDFAATNWFLWNHLRGKFASTFRLRYPRGYDPDARQEDNANETVEDGQQDEPDVQDPTDDDASFNLDDSSDDDDDDEYAGTPEEDETSDAGQEEPDHENKQSEADQHYSWSQKHTIVDFSHQRFRDFLVIESDPLTRQKPCLPVRIDVHSVELDIVFDCFRCLRAGLARGNYVKYYISYPAFNVFSHLASLKQDHLDDDTQTRILRELYWLIHEERGCRTLFAALIDREDGECDAFWQVWLADNRTTSLLQRWFSKAATLESLSEDEKSWMADAATSVLKLLEPLAMTAAKIWLTKESYKDDAYLDKSEFQVWFLKGYRALDEFGHLPDNLAHWIYARDLDFSTMSASEVEDLAEWAGLEKTTHWYTGVGWTLYQLPSENSARAQEFLAKAIEMDSSAWVAMEAMARSLGDDDEEYEKAISWMERAVETLLEHNKDTNLEVDGYLRTHISKWKMELGAVDEALDTAYNAWIQFPTSMPITKQYVRALLQIKDWARLIEILSWLDSFDNDYGVSHLVKFFSELSLAWDVGPAFRAADQPAFVIKALELALRDVEKTGDKGFLISKLLNFGDFYHDYYDRDDRTIHWWEEAIARVADADAAVQREYANRKIVYTNQLAQLYFDAAVDNFEAHVRPNDAALKLKQLALATTYVSGGDEDVFAYYTPGYPSLLYGRWLRDYEKAKPSVWRECFRARILEQMNGLDDDDPTNDTIACRRLAMSLFQAGDVKRASAIVAVLFKTLEEYISGKERNEPEGGVVEEVHEGSCEGGEPGNLDELTDQTVIKAIGEKETEADDKDLGTQTIVPDPEIPPLHEHSQENSAFGPEENLSRRPQATGSEGKGEGNSKTNSQGKLALQLDSDAWGYVCDGCGYDAEDKGNMWFCDICYDIAFCNDCLEKAKVVTLEVRRCNPKHTWHQVWPLDEEKVREMAEEYGMGGKVQLKKEWLQELRNEWLRGPGSS